MAYAPAMGGDAASLVSLEADLHLALERNELRLLFQPIVDLRTRQAVGAEALLRWQHPVEGLLRPDKFLVHRGGSGPDGADHALGHRARVQARRRMAPAPATPGSAVSTSASICPRRRCATRDLANSSRALWRDTRAPASCLKFEITESGLHRQRGRGARGAAPAARHGHRADAGRLRHRLFLAQPSAAVPVRLREDRPAVREPLSVRTAPNSGIMSAMVQIAASLGLKAIAEIIETQAAA